MEEKKKKIIVDMYVRDNKFSINHLDCTDMEAVMGLTVSGPAIVAKGFAMLEDMSGETEIVNKMIGNLSEEIKKMKEVFLQEFKEHRENEGGK